MLELNKLYLMDCREGMKEFPDKYFDLAIVDPPYFKEANIHYFAGQSITKKGIKRKNYHKSICWEIPDQEYYDELIRVSREQIIWGINYFDFTPIPHGRIVWDKQRAGLINSFSDGEIASCSTIKGVRFFRFMWDGMLQGNMKDKEQKIHMTQKPVELYRWILANYASNGDKILDTHAGSASSLIACYEGGFDFVGFEIDPDYHKAATERLEARMAQTTLYK